MRIPAPATIPGKTNIPRIKIALPQERVKWMGVFFLFFGRIEIKFSSSANHETVLRKKSPLPEKLLYRLFAKSESPMTTSVAFGCDFLCP